MSFPRERLRHLQSSGLLLAAMVLAVCFHPASRTSAGDEGGFLTLAVETEAGSPISQASADVFFFGKATNATLWVNTEEPISFYMIYASPPTRVLPLSLKVEEGTLKIPIPEGCSHVYVDVTDPKIRAGGQGGSGCYSGGPFPVGLRKQTIRLPKPRCLKGRVVDAHGSGVPGVGVEARSRCRWLDGSIPLLGGVRHSYSSTGPSGEYELCGCGDGPYVVDFWPGPDHAQPSPELIPRQTTNVKTVVTAKATSTRIRVVDSGGRSVSRACVRIFWKPGPTSVVVDVMPRDVRPSPFYVTDKKGEVVIRWLHPTRSYTVAVFRPAGRKDLSFKRTFELSHLRRIERLVLKRSE